MYAGSRRTKKEDVIQDESQIETQDLDS
jgi:hypothetical protein